MKILIIKTSSLGDIVHTNPIISDLIRNLDDIEIHWLVEESFASLLSIFPIENVIISKFRTWKKNIFNKALLIIKPLKSEYYNILTTSKNNIEIEVACTLIMLGTNQY